MSFSARHAPEVQPARLRVGRLASSVRVLGPGDRSVVWVSYCPLDCTGCIAPELRRADGGAWLEVEELADWVAAVADDGMTFSGGEPMAQAAGLVALADAVRARRGDDFSLMVYTGYRREALESRGTADQRALIARANLLKDGPYVASLHRSLLWRASANQRLHAADDAHATLLAATPDVSAGLELLVLDDGDGPRAGFNGVPAAPGFRDLLEG